MANLRKIARAKARKYGLDPNIFERQINAESGFNPNARSPAGAAGVAQIMPATARGWKVNPMDPDAALNAAAKNMANYVKKYGGYENALRAYNAGPGAIQRSRGYSETNNYVSKILRGRDPGKLGARTRSGEPTPTGRPGRVDPGTPDRVTPDRVRQDTTGALVDALLNRKFGSKRGLLQAANDRIATGAYTSTVPGKTIPGRSPVYVPGDSPAKAQEQRSSGGGGSGGAAAAVGFAQSRIGQYKESAGSNRGPQLDKLQARMGFKGAPWCAIFTSAAVTKGGAPKVARTAAVAEVRRQATQGGGGYQRGFKRRPRPGDLILFKNDHLGLVESVKGGVITTIEGNTGGGVVARRKRAVGSGDIVRPKYRR